MAEPLSVIVMTKDEEHNLPDCLASVAWADEALVVDSGSADRTVELARAGGARVETHPFESYGKQRNWCVLQARHPWVLMVDADERVTPALAEEVKALLARGPEADLYWIRRDNWFLGRRIRRCGWGGDRVIRLFRRDKGRFTETHVHESIHPEGRVGELAGRLEHYPYRSLDQYLGKFVQYSARSARDLRAKGRRAGFFSLTLRPAWRFFRMYVIQRGFLDGVAGLVLCGLAAAQVFVRYARLWADGSDGGDAS